MFRSAAILRQARVILGLGLPLVASHLAQMALHVTDTVLLGWYGVLPLAAAVLGTSYFFLIFILGSGFGIAVMGMVAASLGRGDEAQVRRDTRMGLWLSAGFGVLAYPLMWWSGPVLRLLGQAPELAALAEAFLRIAGLGMAPALVIIVLKSCLSALERPGIVLWATIGAAVANGLLGYALIFGRWGAPELGIEGAAIASLTAQAVSAAVLAAYAGLGPGLRRFGFFDRLWRPDWPALGQVFRTGWPIGLTSMSEGGLFSAASMMMGWIGTVELAAHGIALEIASLAFMVHLGLSNAATVRIGRAAGERDIAGLREGALAAIGLSLAFGLAMVALFLSAPVQVIGLFLDEAKPEAAEILAFGTVLLAVAALFQLFDAMQCMARGLLYGVQDAAVPMWLATVSYWLIGIPASYLLAFPLGYGGVGLWFGLVIGLIAASGLLMARFWRGPARGLAAA